MEPVSPATDPPASPLNVTMPLRVMMTAHRRGACVVAVYTKDVAEAKATNATDAGRRKGYPLLFTTEPEE